MNRSRVFDNNQVIVNVNFEDVKKWRSPDFTKTLEKVKIILYACMFWSTLLFLIKTAIAHHNHDTSMRQLSMKMPVY